MLALSGCAKEIVAHEQSEPEANRIVELLAREGIEAAKVKDQASRELSFNIQVPKEDEVRTYADIVNSLRRIPRVVEASALVSIPDDNPLRDVNEAKPKPKASVIVAYIPDEKNNPPIGVEDVQRFVQASLPELRSTEVSVQLIATGTKEASPGNTLDAASPELLASGNACEKVRVIGIDVCNGHQGRLRNSLIGVVVVAGLLAGMVVLSVLRALRYRKDLTRLTAQVAQLKPR
jgi:type III secretory pathway lipoprotein EscJ